MADRPPRFSPGWWFVPAVGLGATAWMAIARVALNLMTGGPDHG